MRIRPLVIGALTLATALPLSAQEKINTDSLPIVLRRRVEAIMSIPRRADEARKAGAPDSTIRGVIDILTKEKVPPEEAQEILAAQRDGVKENGPTDNFGAFVQQQLAAGRRGRDLAAAIRAEHAARGKGNGDHGRPGDREEAAAGKRPETAGGGRPEGAGRGGRPAGPPAKGKKPN